MARLLAASKRLGLDWQATQSIMTDLGTSRVLDVVPERTREAAAKLWKNMDNLQRKLIQAVAMDMWDQLSKKGDDSLTSRMQKCIFNAGMAGPYGVNRL